MASSLCPAAVMTALRNPGETRSALRNPSVDVAKGMLMLFIIFEHSSTLSYVVRYNQIYTIPCFFFLSGLFFRLDKYERLSDLIQYIARTLYFPFLFFSLVSYLWFLGVEYHFRSGASFIEWYMPLIGVAKAGGRGLIFNGPLWFMPCLAMTMFLFWIMKRLALGQKRADWIVTLFAIFALCLGGFCVQHLGSEHLFSWPLALMMTFFYALGNLLSNRFMDCSAAFSRLKTWGCFACALPLLIVFFFPNFVHLSTGLIPNIGLFALQACVGIVMILLLSLGIGSFSPLEYIGRHSLAFLCLQYPVIRVLRTLLHRGGVEYADTVVGSVLFTLTVALALWPLAEIYGRAKKHLQQKRIWI